MPVLSPDQPSTILITRGTGYIASHTVLAALQLYSNFKVRAIVRTEDKARGLRDALDRQGADTSDSRLEFAYVDDLLSQDQIGRAMDGVQGVVHIALPRPSENLVEEATGSILTVLTSAQRAGTVTRVVMTSSSCASISMPWSPANRLVDSNTWNNAAIDRWRAYTMLNNEAKRAIQHGVDGSWFWTLYEACKTVSEQEAWKWMKENKPAFDLVTILPNTNFGPVIYGEPSSTAEWITMLLQNNENSPAAMKSIPSQWRVDVRDDAKVHLSSLIDANVANKRLWTVSEPWGWNILLAILRKHFPNKPVPLDIEDSAYGPTCQMRVEHELATQLIGNWIGLEQSVVDTAKSIGH
ncbi:NADP-binding protein [Dacryopinax primogenitus]|uniref:NADP-binding protein n=1 Tax=Dacryopinax primogenitus (strain DJM 731) TaxID=1858805 RepID=M5GDQ1_DACPD|nr:NADP-binding protein [Dacryopinax primogenitus]EJU04707.1 NADP-binding protein [Dacryopinax primogenitus]